MAQKAVRRASAVPGGIICSNVLKKRFRHLAPQGDFCSLRFVRERSEVLAVRQNIVQPMETSEDSGAMLTVYAGDGMGYAATGDVSLSGLQRAAEQARGWAMQSAGRSVVDFSKMRTAPPTGEYATHELLPWRHTPLSDKIDLLRTECARLKTDDRIVDWEPPCGTPKPIRSTSPPMVAVCTNILCIWCRCSAPRLMPGPRRSRAPSAVVAIVVKGAWKCSTASAFAAPPRNSRQKRCNYSPPRTAHRR